MKCEIGKFGGRSSSSMLVVLLTIGSPGFSNDASPAVTSGGDITVASNPGGAMVYLDGVAQGFTPVELKDVDDGDHRVTILKDGYLENSQVVSVKPGEQKEIQISLTESPDARYSVQTGSSSGGGSKWPLILGIAGGGAAGAYFLLRDTNDPPTSGTISATPNLGLVSVTNFSFTSQGASDPDGDTLTFSWDFGDGSTGSGQSANHTYQSTGGFSVSVSVSDGEETASASTSVTVRSLAGSWSGTFFLGGGTFSFGADFTQTGTSLGGTFRSFGDTGSISGTVSAPNNVRFTVTIPGFQPFTLRGTIDDDLNGIAGTITGSGFTGERFTMTR